MTMDCTIPYNLKIKKIDKFVKRNLLEFRINGLPIRLDKDTIAVGNSIIRKYEDAIIVNDSKNDMKITLHFIYTALILSKYIHHGLRPNTMTWNRILDYDRKLEKYSYESSIFTKKRNKSTDYDKQQFYNNRIDHCQQSFTRNLIELNQLNKWDVR